MTAGLDDISRLLGNLEARIEGLGRQVSQNDIDARQRWSLMHVRMDKQDERLDVIVREADDTSDNVKYLKDVLVGDVKPITDEVRRWKTMGMGALAIIGVGGAAFGSGAMWLLTQLGWIKPPA